MNFLIKKGKDSNYRVNSKIALQLAYAERCFVIISYICGMNSTKINRYE